MIASNNMDPYLCMNLNCVASFIAGATKTPQTNHKNEAQMMTNRKLNQGFRKPE